MTINFSELEKNILEFWKREKIFQKTLDKKSPKGTFVFVEGPPTANGRPGIHHVLTRAFKDIVLRYKTMQGYRVPRKAGWDTHGLPVELEVEKKLGISGKKQIENIVPGDARASIIKFNKLCKESVWTYLHDWEAITERVAFWLDLENPYITYQNSYIETLWWIIKKVYDRGLLYEDYKIVPYCPRCGTTLSSHEVALGYKDDTPDPSIFVKFKISPSALSGKVLKTIGTNQKVYFLVWTTTPWTLPGNVALAVGKDIKYIKIRLSGPEPHSQEDWILAKDRLSVITEGYEILEEMDGKDLVGLEYEPLYLIVSRSEASAAGATQSFTFLSPNDYKIYTAPFVSVEDGTGIVHIAPAFGEDDYNLGKEKKLRTLLTVDLDGKISADVPGKGKFVKEADKDIIENLRERGLVYKSEIVKHTYPFCWRCDTPLLYYAKISWWIEMSKLGSELIKNNRKINWVPKHLREGRFGEWLRNIKDWAFSRERYWGTPLPIWKCAKCKNLTAVGALHDFPKSKNQYFIMRHGETNANTGRIVTSDLKAPYNLTKAGKDKVAETARRVKKKKIDLIISSDYPRTRQTAEIVSEKLKVEVQYDTRLREINFGDYEGLAVAEYHKNFSNALERFDKPAPNGETLGQVLARQVALINELENKYQKKNILLVGHGDPLWILEAAYLGLDAPGMIRWANMKENYIRPGEMRELEVRKLPQDDHGFVDLHRPYVDQIIFDCKKCGGQMRRSTDVCDVWFDSGAAPLAQYHYPFENKKLVDKKEAFPADYISEAIDQTRGWFYTLLAVSTLLGYKVPPYKNVISLGHILDAKGQKMSKSRGNIVRPEEVLEKYGADALRLYFYTSGQPGEPKKFDVKSVDEMLKKTILILWNVFEFWKLYSDNLRPTTYDLQPKAKNVLDNWILAKLNLLIKEATKHLDKYEITEAGRKIADFINDLSTWYLRRSRDRFKKDGDDKEAALVTLAHVLTTVSQLFAPFTPFVAEKIYKEVTGNQSVHLETWPKVCKNLIDEKLLKDMENARRIVSLALEERAKASIPVRQPLLALKIKTTSLNPEILKIIRDEINVKEVTHEAGVGEISIKLDTMITPELRLEGMKRDLVRQINTLRKEARLTIHDQVDFYYETASPDLQTVVQKFTDDLKISTLSGAITPGRVTVDFEKNLEISDNKIWVGLKKQSTITRA